MPSLNITCQYFRNDTPLPQAMGDSDVAAATEIVEMEAAIYTMYNEEFLTNPGAITDRFYISDGEDSFYDLLIPGEYNGADVKRYFNFIGPQFQGLMEAGNIKVWVKGESGFVVLRQYYGGKDLEGNEFKWVMRQTDGVVKRDGAWKIAHTHYSWPVEVPDFKADLMCKPGPHPWELATT